MLASWKVGITLCRVHTWFRGWLIVKKTGCDQTWGESLCVDPRDKRTLDSLTLSTHLVLRLWRAGIWVSHTWVFVVFACICSYCILLPPPPSLHHWVYFSPSCSSFSLPFFSWLNPGWPKVLKAFQWQSPLYWTVKMLAEKTIHKSVKYIVKIAYNLWNSVLSKLILTRFECCSEMWQLHTHIGCFSSLPLAACEQCCHDTPWALFRSAIFWRSPWPSPQ